MKYTCMGLTAVLAFAVFGTTTVLAQPAAPDVKVEVDNSNTRFVVSALAGSTDDVQEEVEILRRLLASGLAHAYGSHPPKAMASAIYWAPLLGIRSNSNNGPPGMPSMGGNNGGMSRAFVPADRVDHLAPLEGMYLKDYGVVYTATLPSPPKNPLPGTTVGVVTRAPVSDWERARKELRGEAVEPEEKVLNGPPPMAEVILKVLAENGKHFTRLAEAERITVVVTFRGAVGEYRVPIQYSAGELLVPILDAANSSGESQPGSSINGNLMPPELGDRVSLTPPKWEADVRNAISLGDLHLKRGKGQDAIAAYADALDKLGKELASSRIAQGRGREQNAVADEIPFLLTAVDIFNRQAQAFVQTRDSKAAGEALQKASEWAKKAEMLTGGAAAANPQPSTPALPSKLVVTASKKLLDEVGSGKTTFEAFRKAATVEYVTPPAADKK